MVTLSSNIKKHYKKMTPTNQHQTHLPVAPRKSWYQDIKMPHPIGIKPRSLRGRNNQKSGDSGNSGSNKTGNNNTTFLQINGNNSNDLSLKSFQKLSRSAYNLDFSGSKFSIKSQTQTLSQSFKKNLSKSNTSLFGSGQNDKNIIKPVAPSGRRSAENNSKNHQTTAICSYHKHNEVHNLLRQSLERLNKESKNVISAGTSSYSIRAKEKTASPGKKNIKRENQISLKVSSQTNPSIPIGQSQSPSRQTSLRIQKLNELIHRNKDSSEPFSAVGNEVKKPKCTLNLKLLVKNTDTSRFQFGQADLEDPSQGALSPGGGQNKNANGNEHYSGNEKQNANGNVNNMNNVTDNCCPNDQNNQTIANDNPNDHDINKENFDTKDDANCNKKERIDYNTGVFKIFRSYKITLLSFFCPCVLVRRILMKADGNERKGKYFGYLYFVLLILGVTCGYHWRQLYMLFLKNIKYQSSDRRHHSQSSNKYLLIKSSIVPPFSYSYETDKQLLQYYLCIFITLSSAVILLAVNFYIRIKVKKYWSMSAPMRIKDFIVACICCCCNLVQNSFEVELDGYVSEEKCCEKSLDESLQV